MKKYAACNGNQHVTIRVTPFFDTADEARAAAPNADFVTPFANWKEHEQWSREGKGMYSHGFQVEV